MHDSLNPIAGLVPLVGMWLNCIWGGVGVGLINLLIYLIVGAFLAGLMVGRTPEYLGKKVETREMKLAALALLIHPLMILAPIAFAASLATKEATPNYRGTLRTDTITFGFVLLGTILLVGALLFLPVAALGPVAEHFGPIPFGG